MPVTRLKIFGLARRPRGMLNLASISFARFKGTHPRHSHLLTTCCDTPSLAANSAWLPAATMASAMPDGVAKVSSMLMPISCITPFYNFKHLLEIIFFTNATVYINSRFLQPFDCDR